MGREGGSKEGEEGLVPPVSFKSDKCAAGNMTEKNNIEGVEYGFGFSVGVGGGGGVVDRGLEESKN